MKYTGEVENSILVSKFKVGWQSLAYCTGLESRRGCKSSRGSNPLPTAQAVVEQSGSSPAWRAGVGKKTCGFESHPQRIKIKIKNYS